MPERLKVIFKNSRLPSDRTAEVEEAIADRVTDLAGGPVKLKQLWDQPDRRYSPVNKFNLYYEQAIREALHDIGYSPTARAEVIMKPEWVQS